MNSRLRIILPIVVILLLAGAAVGWYYYSRSTATDSGAITASGTIETVQVIVSPEISGRATDVLVSQGDAVTAGQPLLQLDDTLLQTQRKLAIANLSLAKANYQISYTSSKKALDDLLRSQTPLAQAELALANAKKALENAQDDYETAVQNNNKGWVRRAEDQVDQALADYQYYLHHNDGSIGALIEQHRRYQVYLNALRELKKAEDYYRMGIGASGGNEDTEMAFGIAQGKMDLAQAQYDDALAEYNRLKDGVPTEDLKAAQARVDTAQAMLDQAQANLDLIDAQIAKLTVYAPADGTILERDIEPGEMALAGSASLVIGELNKLTITVYVPEDRYGDVRLGQTVLFTVDSFPGKTFGGSVTRIANQAEFTPRNVQTVEGRSTTVFAVEITVENPTPDLKPGMPADVTFKP